MDHKHKRVTQLFHSKVKHTLIASLLLQIFYNPMNVEYKKRPEKRKVLNGRLCDRLTESTDVTPAVHFGKTCHAGLDYISQAGYDL